MNSVFDAKIQAYVDHIKADYLAWSTACLTKSDPTIRAQMIQEFNDGIQLEKGRKYLKVVSRGNGVHSFVVLKDGKDFKAGDILKAASWAAPATNFARGNVLTGNFGNTHWTGA